MSPPSYIHIAWNVEHTDAFEQSWEAKGLSLMAKPFKNLVDKMSPDSQKRIKERTAQMHSEMALQELR